MSNHRLPRGEAAWLWLVLGLLLVELAATGLDLTLGPHDRLHWEEGINARAGVLLACGHLDRLWDLQYQPFCGGCSADAVLGAGLFSVLPPTVLTFKAIPAAFHLLLLAAGSGLAWRAVGGRGALAFLALMLGTPTVFRQLGLIGWGNHAESMAFPVLAAWLLSRAGASPRSTGWAAGAGAVAGIGAWYCYTSAHALPALLLLALLPPRGLRNGAAFVGGALAGLAPWWAYLAYHPGLLSTLPAPPAAHALPRVSELFAFVAGPDMVRGLWPDLGPGPTGQAWGSAYWYGLWALALLGSVAAAGMVRRVDQRPGARRVALYAPLALVGLLAAYAWRHGAWAGPSGRVTNNFLGLRYLSPLLPTLALCAAATQTQAIWRPLRGLALLLALGLGAGGLVLRTQEWSAQRDRWVGRSVCTRDAPAGPLAYPESPDALVAHLGAEPDEPLLCRRDHLIELAGSLCAPGVVPPLAEGILATAHSPAEVGSFLDPCLRQAWGDRLRAPGGCRVATWRSLLDTSCARMEAGCEAWRPEVATSLLRAATWDCITRDLDAGAIGDDPALRAAWCRLRGEDAVFQVHEAPDPAAAPLPLLAACASEPSYAWGAGWAWPRWFGCSAGAMATWRRAGGPALGTAAEEGLAAGCPIYAPSSLRP